MIRWYRILVCALVVASLVAGSAARGPRSDAARLASPRPLTPSVAAGTPPPQVLVGQPPAWEPLPNGCRSDQVLSTVQDFIAAFNRGEEARLAALFRPDVPDADGTPDSSDVLRNPGWFAVRGLTGVDARNDGEMLAWTAGRRARGERWTLLQLFMEGYWWRGGVNVSFDLRREADDLPTRVVGGKGAVDCDDGTIFLWNMGGSESIPDDLFEPGPRPTPGVG